MDGSLDGSLDESLESTATLVRALQDGNAAARERLFQRCLPLLRRWAHGRLPQRARDLADTDDLVQVSLLRALNNMDRFEAGRPGALLAYLRTILLNAVREELRRSDRRSADRHAEVEPADDAPSVLERAIGQQTLDAYERALSVLTEKQRNAVILRLEFDMTYPEIAMEMEAESSAAARMLVVRGLAELTRRMG
ncbi:sigma-70 family RNA polymerase sigma factor [Halomonas denitrificans]|nr:sigma-70 family RNA polymerase sigma factor [Halomonas denitrificans]